MRITVLVDVEALPDHDPKFKGLTAEIRQATEYHVAASLRTLGHTVEVLAFGPSILETTRRLMDSHTDLIFNLTEHFQGDRRHDMHIAALLELFRLPYTGTGPEGLLLCRDKALCKQILGHHRIRVPQFAAVPVGQTRPEPRIAFPSIVKPLYEDGSDGISLASLVRSEEERDERIRLIHDRMKQPAICEEYIEGRELYIGIIGNEKLTAFPARELRFGHGGEGAPHIATAMVKRNAAYRKKWGITYDHAGLPDDLERRAAHLGKRIYRLLHLRDYGRIDLRLTPAGEFVFLEANPNPDLAADDDLAQSALQGGLEYERLIERTVGAALRRQGRT